MMDSFELTKIAAGVLSALLVIFGVKTFVEISTSGHGHGAHHAGYTLPLPKEGGAAASAPAATAAAFDKAKVAAAAASASAEAGEGVFKKCSACHTVNSGGANKTGPNLHAIVGRPVASVASFSGYSGELKAKGGAWDVPELAAFLHDPKGYLPGTKMGFAGIKDEADLAALLSYLAKQK